MEITRELLLMLQLRARAADRARRRVERNLLPKERAAYLDGQSDEATKACEIASMMYQVHAAKSPELEEQRRHIIALSAERKEYVTLEDGATYWWPQGSPHGALSAWQLRTLADELDRRNRAVEARIERGSLDS